MIERLTIQILRRNIVLEANDNFLINIYLNNQGYISNNQTLLLTKKRLKNFYLRKENLFLSLISLIIYLLFKKESLTKQRKSNMAKLSPIKN